MLYFSAICAIAITCIACCVKRFMRKKREADLEKKESKGKNGVDLKVRITKEYRQNLKRFNQKHNFKLEYFVINY